MVRQRQLTDEQALEIYLTPASAPEMAAEYGVGVNLVRNIRGGLSYSAITRGLPKPPFIERSHSNCFEVVTEPLQQKHEQIAALIQNTDVIDYVNQIVPEALKRCTHREWQVFEMRYDHKLTLDMVAARVKRTRERVRQIENKLHRKMAWFIATEMPNDQYVYIEKWLRAAKQEEKSRNKLLRPKRPRKNFIPVPPPDPPYRPKPRPKPRPPKRVPARKLTADEEEFWGWLDGRTGSPGIMRY